MVSPRNGQRPNRKAFLTLDTRNDDARPLPSAGEAANLIDVRSIVRCRIARASPWHRCPIVYVDGATRFCPFLDNRSTGPAPGGHSYLTRGSATRRSLNTQGPR